MGPGQQNPVSLALAELQTALADGKTTPDQLKEKLSTLRAARQKTKTDLAAAQKELAALLTPDQQAALTSLGYLD
jgi:chromosome segregation ATPase